MSIVRQRPDAAAGYTREQVLKTAGVAAVGVGLTGLLAACGGDDAASTATTGTTGTTADAAPKRGGTLELRLTGSSTESIDPAKSYAGNDAAYCSAYADRLIRLDTNFQPQAELAESWEPNADGSAWTFKLRAAKFSDGTPVTSADVAATVKHVLDTSTGSPVYATASAALEPSGIEIVDDTTIRFALKHPSGDFPIVISDRNFGIIKEGTLSAKLPTGAGPFMLKSFTAGESWEAVRNPHY